MALLFIDSFDHYATAEIGQKWGTGNAVIGAYGRNGTNGMRIANALGTSQRINVVPGSTTAVVGMALTMANVLPDSHNPLFHIMDGGTAQITVRINASDPTVRVYRGNSTLLGSSTLSLTAGLFYYLELKTTIHGSTGTVELKSNGTTVLSLTGQNTSQTGANQWTGVLVGGGGGSGFVLNQDVDDLYICDTAGSVNNDFLGPIRVKAIYPDGAGNSTDFTPSAGSNYQNVDETSTDGDTTYNSEGTAGDHDTYTFGAVGLTGTVRGVQTNLMVRSDGGGSETIRPKIRIGGVDYNGTTVGISTSYTDSREVFNVSPATSTTWTVSEIDGAEFGIELVS